MVSGGACSRSCSYRLFTGEAPESDDALAHLKPHVKILGFHHSALESVLEKPWHCCTAAK
eukprot:6185224-Pleurochrysis_carterae.AAC.3